MANRNSTRFLDVGYRKASEVLSRLFTVAFVTVLIIVSAPLSVAISLLILITDGPPVFYSGWRLGKNKRLYRMYKFRTLATDAQQRIGAELFTSRLSSNRELLTRTGGFLRDTRLDELPQLFNVLKGDMDILGPRPERPEVYEKLCKQIKGYDRRFSVKPGLIGYSQIFTPHSASKRIRYLIDNKFLSLKHRYSLEVLVVALALGLLFFRMVYRAAGIGARLPGRLLRGKEKRALPRLEPENIAVLLAPRHPAAGAPEKIEGTLKDINEEALLVHTATAVEGTDLKLLIVVPVVNWRGTRLAKTIHLSGKLYFASRSGKPPYLHGSVIKYTPLTPLNSYLVHQYLLDGSIAHVRKGKLPATGILPQLTT